MTRKFLTIGRHSFSPKQEKLLGLVGLEEEAGKIPQVRDVKEVIEIAKQNGIKDVVVQGLPMPLLAELVQQADREGINVYGFRLEAVGLVKPGEECPEDADIQIPSREGTIRCISTKALQRLKKIAVVAEDLVSL